MASASRPPHVLAVDLGGTNLRCAIVDVDGRILHRASILTPFDERVGDAIVRLAQSVRGDHAVGAAVIAVPGRVDYERGVLEWGRGHPAAWRDILVATRFEHALGLPVQLANDADAAAVGEAAFGAGRGCETVVYLTVSTGLGAGAVHRGCLLHTRVSMLEIGLTTHTMPASSDDAISLVEDVASGRGLARDAAAAGIDVEPRELIARAESGDEVAARLWERACQAAAHAATNLAHLLMPDIVVLGGGVGGARESLRSEVESVIGRHGPQGLPRPIAVRMAQLGDDAGLAGAAAWDRAMARSHSSAAPATASAAARPAHSRTSTSATTPTA